MASVRRYAGGSHSKPNPTFPVSARFVLACIPYLLTQIRPIPTGLASLLLRSNFKRRFTHTLSAESILRDPTQFKLPLESNNRSVGFCTLSYPPVQYSPCRRMD